MKFDYDSTLGTFLVLVVALGMLVLAYFGYSKANEHQLACERFGGTYEEAEYTYGTAVDKRTMQNPTAYTATRCVLPENNDCEVTSGGQLHCARRIK